MRLAVTWPLLLPVWAAIARPFTRTCPECRHALGRHTARAALG